MPEHQYITAAKTQRALEISAEAAEMKAKGSYAVSDVRQAEADALNELAERDFGSPEEVEAVEGVSPRVLEYDKADDDEE